MADTGLTLIEPGASVDGVDGHLGRVARVTAVALEVLAEDTGQRFMVPMGLVRDVGPDGSVRLSATRVDLERLAALGPDSERGDLGRGDLGPVEPPQMLQLSEEELIARKRMAEVGRVRFHKEVEEVPRRLEVDAYHEEVTVEHVPIGRVVQERQAVREEGDTYIVPVYEEQLVVVKRLVLKEEIRIRRQGVTERRLFEDTVRRERLVVEDPDETGRVRDYYPTERPEGERVAGDTVPGEEETPRDEGGLLERLGRKVLE
jgi:uncharacterized protein (TIGR02271 family)